MCRFSQINIAPFSQAPKHLVQEILDLAWLENETSFMFSSKASCEITNVGFFFPSVENNGFSTGQQIGERSQIFLDANTALNYLVLTYSRVWCKRPDDAG